MRQSSIVIHKGRKEEKYEIYVEDYVISFLKEKASAEKIPEIVFYGCREKSGRRYTIYGAGQDRHLAVFDKYDLLEEIGCRLIQTDPVFLVREPGGVYEVKGYKVFYYNNEEMQEYLIHRDHEERRQYSPRSAGRTGGRVIGRNAERPAAYGSGKPHYAISLQLGVVFVVLVAIVINSSNSYNKMKQLNQSAEEVFFVMENQEAEGTARTDGKEKAKDIVIEREQLQENMVQENVKTGMSDKEGGGKTDSEEAGSESKEEVGEDADVRTETDLAEATSAVPPEEDETGADGKTEEENTSIQEQTGQEESRTDPAQSAEEKSGEEMAGEEEGVEALSRNVARYYEVRRGDTLYMISQKIYGDTAHVKKICELNQITDPDNIHYGQKIILP